MGDLTRHFGTGVHTEDEAMAKSCCGPMQAEFGKTHVVNCMASACMAWRWVGFRYTSAFGTQRRGRMVEQEKIESAYNWQHYEPDRVGFCGLAGPPTP